MVLNTRLSFSQEKGSTGRGALYLGDRPDVLINLEEIGWVVFSFQRSQARIIAAVACLEASLAFIMKFG